MTREHLYKAKRKDNGEWVYGSYVQTEELLEDAMHFIVGGYGDRLMPIEVDGNTVCEYTGLKDKNGTKVFEGDVINIYVSDWWCGHKDVKIYEENALITYNDYAWAIRHGKFTTPVYDYIHPHDTDKRYYFEVIGNKFDNPELLEVQDEQAN